MSSNFRYQPFLAVSGNRGEKILVVDDALSSHKQEIYPTASFDENCIEFDFKTDCNYYVELRQTYLALKLKIVKARGYETYKTKRNKKSARKRQKRKKKRRCRRSRRLRFFSILKYITFCTQFFPILK